MSSTLDLDPLWYHSLLVHIFLVNHLGFADSSIKVQWRTVWSRQITACDIFVSSHIYFEFLFADSSDTIHSQALLALSAHLDTQLEHAGKLLSRSSNTAFSSTDILHSTNPDSLHNSSLDAFFFLVSLHSSIIESRLTDGVSKYPRSSMSLCMSTRVSTAHCFSSHLCSPGMYICVSSQLS